MDFFERLTGAKKAADEGRHAEALAEYRRYHEHAAGVPGQRGVRLSYALAFWWELAQVYAPAKLAFEALRASKAARLLSGDGDSNLFHDVVAIDHALKQRVLDAITDTGARDAMRRALTEPPSVE